MKAELPGLIAAALVVACGAKSVDLGNEPLNEADGNAKAASGGRTSATVDSATGGSGSTSSSVVVPHSCGDGKWDAGEACDDGNSEAGDGCNADCSPEPGWQCTSGVCSWVCDGYLVASPELCTPGACPDRLVTPPAPPPGGAVKGPCDIYAEDGGPCVAAHSTVRSLYATYPGPLYQVKNANGATRDIMPVTPGGFANAATQDTFCAQTACTISIVYDQSGHGNDLTKAPPGGAKLTPGKEANAIQLPVTVGFHQVYGLRLLPGVAYRNNNACGTATGDDPETEYMVVAGDVYNGGCCFDYGNVERDSRDDGEGAVEAVNFGAVTIWGKGAGSGPWVMGDLENGLWAGDVTPYQGNESLSFKLVTAMVKGDGPGKNHWTIKTGNAQSGSLHTPFDGPRPSARYVPMRKQGGIGLGAAGDNSNAAVGNFFEGVMTAHYSSDAADAAVQANLVATYGAP